MAGSDTSIVPGGRIDPVLPHYHNWHAACDKWCRLIKVLDDRHPFVIAARDEMDAAFHMLIRTVPATDAGVAALIRVLWQLDGPTDDPEAVTADMLRESPSAAIMHSVLRACGQSAVALTGEAA